MNEGDISETSETDLNVFRELIYSYIPYEYWQLPSINYCLTDNLSLIDIFNSADKSWNDPKALQKK